MEESGEASHTPRAGSARCYAVPFREVWRELDAVLRQMPRWRRLSEDPQRGEIRLETRGWLRRAPREVGIRVRLDEMGATCVEFFSLGPDGRPGPARRIPGLRRVLRRLDQALQRGTTT